MSDLREKVRNAIFACRPFDCHTAFDEAADAAIAVCMEEAAKVAREAALYSGCPADFIADEIAASIRALRG